MLERAWLCSCKRRATRSSLTHLLKAAAVICVGLWAQGANAEVILFSSYAGEQEFTTSGLLDFNGTASGGTTLSFSTTQANQRVSIIFDATCYVSGVQSYAIVNIVVDPAGPTGEFNAPPTNGIANNGVVFCNADSSGTSATRASVVASARPGQAGTNTVKVRVRPATLSSSATPKIIIQTPSLTVIR